MIPVWQHSCGCTMGWPGFWQCLSCNIGQNGLHGGDSEVPAPFHGRLRGCMFCVFFALIMACTKSASWAPVHAGIYVIQVFWHQRTYLRHNHCRVCTCTRVCAVGSFAFRDEGGGVQLVYAEFFSLGVGDYFWQKDWEIRVLFCVFSSFDAGESVRRVCMCVYTHQREPQPEAAVSLRKMVTFVTWSSSRTENLV